MLLVLDPTQTFLTWIDVWPCIWRRWSSIYKISAVRNAFSSYIAKDCRASKYSNTILYTFCKYLKPLRMKRDQVAVMCCNHLRSKIPVDSIFIMEAQNQTISWNMDFQKRMKPLKYNWNMEEGSQVSPRPQKSVEAWRGKIDKKAHLRNFSLRMSKKSRAGHVINIGIEKHFWKEANRHVSARITIILKEQDTAREEMVDSDLHLDIVELVIKFFNFCDEEH